MDWTDLADDTDSWQTLVNAAMKLWVQSHAAIFFGT
jgi:hypothetical protein